SRRRWESSSNTRYQAAFLSSSSENHSLGSVKCRTGWRSKKRNCCESRSGSNLRLISTSIRSSFSHRNDVLNDGKRISCAALETAYISICCHSGLYQEW